MSLRTRRSVCGRKTLLIKETVAVQEMNYSAYSLVCLRSDTPICILAYVCSIRTAVHKRDCTTLASSIVPRRFGSGEYS